MLSTLLLLSVCTVAIHASIVDKHSFRLPNTHTGAIAAMNLVLFLMWSSLDGIRYQVALQWIAVAVAHGLLAMLPGRVFGMGDAKLVGALALVMLWWGAFTEWMLLSYLAASARGVTNVRSGWSQRIAFGPYLSGAWMLIVVGQLARVAMAYGR